MSLQQTDATVLRETLLDIPDVLPLVVDGTEYKIFWEHVPEDVDLPYIVMLHLTGGEDDDAQSRATNTFWTVVGVTADMTTASELDNAIDQLHRKMPVSSIDGVCGYTWIARQFPVFNRFVVSGKPVFEVGGIYRLRLSIGA